MTKKSVKGRLSQLVRIQKTKLAHDKASSRVEQNVAVVQQRDAAKEGGTVANLLVYYDPIFRQLLTDIASISSQILFADVDKHDRRKKSWTARLYLLHPELCEVFYRFTFDAEGAEISFEGKKLWPEDEEDSPSFEARWRAAMDYIETDFLKGLSVLVAEAEAQYDIVIESCGTKSQGIERGKRWAAFSEDWQRARFSEEFGDTVERDFEWYGGGRDLCCAITYISDFDDTAVAEFWDLPTDWHVALIPDEFLQGFLIGACEQLANFEEMQHRD